MSTRNAIMNAAEDAVRKKGCNGFSIAEIARDVGIQKSSLYFHFSSKLELLGAIFRRYSDQIFSFLEQTARAEKWAGDRLMAYILEMRAVMEEGESVCLSIALIIDPESLSPEIVGDLRLFHQTNITWLTETFELGQRDGSITDIGDPAEEASACLALVDGGQLMARAHQDPVLYDQATGILRSRITVSAPKDTEH